MTEAIIAGGCSIIVGILSLIGVMVTNSRSNHKMQNEIKIAQAVTDTKINELTREVRKHNDFATRIPVLDEKIDVVNHRISDLEDFHKPH